MNLHELIDGDDIMYSLTRYIANSIKFVSYAFEELDDIISMLVKRIMLQQDEKLFDVQLEKETLLDQINDMGFLKKVNSKEYEAFLLGQTYALLRTQEIYNRQEIKVEIFKEALDKDGYVPKLIEVCYKYPGLSQKNLAQRLSMQITTLSNHLRKIDKYKFIRYNIMGKNRLYYVTPLGLEFREYVKKTEKLQLSEGYYCASLPNEGEIKDYIRANVNAHTLFYAKRRSNTEKVFTTEVLELTNFLKKERVSIYDECR